MHHNLTIFHNIMCILYIYITYSSLIDILYTLPDVLRPGSWCLWGCFPFCQSSHGQLGPVDSLAEERLERLGQMRQHVPSLGIKG